MQRATVILLLSVLLLAAAMVCLPLWPPTLRGLIPPGAVRALTIVLLAGATAVGMASALASHRRFRRLTARVDAARRMDRFAHLIACGDAAPLVHAINGLMDTAESSLAAAADQVRQLQIELKVATSERQNAEAILHSISDAVLVTDRFDEVSLVNDAAARIFDFDVRRAPRTSIGTLLRDERIVQLVREMRQSDSRGGRRVVEHSVATATGARTYKVTLSCVADRTHEPAGVVTVLHDISRERELAAMKNDFVSSVSHELRTPLASIKAYVEMLVDGEANDEKTQREFYEVINNEATRLERLIDNILNISRIESGLVKVTKTPQSLMVIVKEVLEVISPQAAQKQIALEEKLTPAFYQTLVDRDMMYQAVLNLLSNAVKYTPQGGRITVETFVDEQARKVATRITDTGVGIPPKDLPFVFDKFYRAEANNRLAKGTGLGLSLVKHIVETVHQGRVLVESQVGKGSTFGFELDLV